MAKERALKSSPSGGFLTLKGFGYTSLYRLFTLGMRYHCLSTPLLPNSIFIFFHQELFGLPFLSLHLPYPVADYNFLFLVSPHRDGEIIYQIATRYGIEGIRAVSLRQPLAGYRSLLKRSRAKKNTTPVIAVDGPVGPARELRPGVVALALATGKPIQVGFYYSNRCFIFKKSWDCFKVPYPLSQLYFYFSKPHYLKAPANLAKLSLADRKRRQAQALVELKAFMLREEATFHAALKQQGINPAGS